MRVSMHVTVCSRDREREIESETELDAFKSEAREGFGQQIGPREMDLRKESFSKLCGSKKFEGSNPGFASLQQNLFSRGCSISWK